MKSDKRELRVSRNHGIILANLMQELLLVSAIVIVGLAAFAWYLNRQLSEVKKLQASDLVLERIRSLGESIGETKKMFSESLLTSSQRLSDSMAKQTRDIHDRLSRAAEVIGDLKREAGSFSEVGRSMKELHEFLKSPKLRGNIGEQVLGDLLAQMIPKNSFHFQYAFRSGDKVDAAIKTDAGILPIDSKFPMENFQRMVGSEEKADRDRAGKEFANDVRRHVRAIATKYIAADEGTTDFAIMYVPSESVFYEIATNADLMDYARRNRIYPTSPNTMYATLSIIMRAFQGKEFAARSRQLLHVLRAIEKDYGSLEETLNVMGTHLSNAYHKFGDLSGKSQLLGQKISRSISLGNEEELPLLEEQNTSVPS